MPDVQEVFRMATQKVRPEEGFVDRQLGHQRRRARNRKLGALGLVAAIGVVAAVFAIKLAGEEDRSQPAVQPAPPPTPDVAYTIDLNTGDMTPLPESLTGGDYSVSPDGTMFAYTSIIEGPSTRLYVADAGGADVHEIPTGGLDAGGPSWSPDGSLLVFQGLRHNPRAPTVGDLFVFDLTSDDVRRITDLQPRTKWWSDRPSFGPDGETILFHMLRRSDAGPRWDVWSVPVAGGEPTLVRRDAAMGVYAPDGRTLAYLDAPRAEDGGGWSSSLWLSDAGGRDPRLLVDGDFHFLRWSPDGTRIAYSGGGEIHVVDVATGESTHVADGDSAVWLDADTLVVTPEVGR